MEEKKELDELINFLIQVGKLKERKRRGWLAHKIKNPETTASHIFRATLLAWVLARKKKGLNQEKVLKMALIHDLCEVHTKDETPYDPLLPNNLQQNREKVEKVLDKWPNFTLKQKREKILKKYKREFRSLKKLVSGLPQDLKEEIINLWREFENGLSEEGRFVRQIDKAENYLQGMEYWKRYGKIRQKLWARWAKEIFDDPVIVKFFRALDDKLIK